MAIDQPFPCYQNHGIYIAYIYRPFPNIFAERSRSRHGVYVHLPRCAGQRHRKWLITTRIMTQWKTGLSNTSPSPPLAKASIPPVFPQDFPSQISSKAPAKCPRPCCRGPPTSRASASESSAAFLLEVAHFVVSSMDDGYGGYDGYHGWQAMIVDTFARLLW